MTPEPSQMALALAIEFVADISYNPRTNQYRIDLTEPYQSELPREQNFLLLNVSEFTVDRLLDTFESNVIPFYQRRYYDTLETLVRVRLGLQATDAK